MPATSIQWIVLTYMVTFAVALIPAGRLADRVGHARVFRGGLALTGVAHLLCGLAPAWAWLLGARVAQGLGAALVMASAPALVDAGDGGGPPRAGAGPARPGGEPRAPSWARSAAASSSARSGGASCTWARLPLVLLALGLGRRLLAVARAPPAPSTARQAERAARGRRRRRGLADRRTFVIANAAHLPRDRGALRRLAPRALLPDRPARLPVGVGGPPLHDRAARAGRARRPLGGRLADRGAGRWLAPLGLAVEAVGLWLTGRLDDAAAPARIAVALGLGGFGSGLFIVANMHYVMGALPPARQGVAGSLVALMRTAGVVVGASRDDRRLRRAPVRARAPRGAGRRRRGLRRRLRRGRGDRGGPRRLLSLVPPRARARRGASVP